MAVKNICYVTDETVGVRFCPSQKTYGYVEKGYQNILETNSWGLHDRERRIEKEPGTFRIQVYGDSMIQGYCVPTAETIPSLAERYLNEQNPPVRFEVANLAPADDGTSSQVMMYQKIGRQFRPDLVICYFMDDFPDNVVQIHRREYSPYHKLTDSGELALIPPIPKGPPDLWERFKKASRLYRLLANKVLESKAYNDLNEFRNQILHAFHTSLASAKNGEQKGYIDLRQEICISESWPLTTRLIRHFRDQVEADGGKFVLVDGEPFYDVNVGTRYKNKDLEKYCRENGINYIPAYVPYAKIKDLRDQGKYFFRDNHLRPAGNRIMGRFLAEEILKIIPPRNTKS